MIGLLPTRPRSHGGTPLGPSGVGLFAPRRELGLGALGQDPCDRAGLLAAAQAVCGTGCPPAAGSGPGVLDAWCAGHLTKEYVASATASWCHAQHPNPCTGTGADPCDRAGLLAAAQAVCGAGCPPAAGTGPGVMDEWCAMGPAVYTKDFVTSETMKWCHAQHPNPCTGTGADPAAVVAAPAVAPIGVDGAQVTAILLDIVGDADDATRAALRDFCGLNTAVHPNLSYASSPAALIDCVTHWCTLQAPGRCDGPHSPNPLTSVPAPGHQTTPGAETAPPTPLQECNAPLDVTLDPTERWVEVDPVQCLWQIIRNEHGTQQALPNVYGGQASILIPQSAPGSETPLSPGSVGLYQPSWQTAGAPYAGGLEVSSAEILQAFLDILGRGPTPDELNAAEAQHFTNVGDLDTYLQGLSTTGATGTPAAAAGVFGMMPTWVTDHPYIALAVAGGGLWLLTKKKHR